MALRDQPYLPLYIQDIMTDERLNECSAATHGIYIKGIMCLMHKSDEYGKILLKLKYKQNSSMCLNFAQQLVKHLPYSVEEIEAAIEQLISERVCYFEGDYLCQKRMIKDNQVSEARSKAGKKGGGNPGFVKTKPQTPVKTKPQTNSEYEYEYEYDNISSSLVDNLVNKDAEKEKNWRNNFQIYLADLRSEYSKLISDSEWMAERQRFNPGVNIQLTLEKACKEFWATEAGWKNKKASKSKSIDWKQTLNNAVSLKSNRVYGGEQKPIQKSGVDLSQYDIPNEYMFGLTKEELTEMCINGEFKKK